MFTARKENITYNAALGPGERTEIKYALKHATTMSERDIETVFQQLDAYPDDRAMILGEINQVLNPRGIVVVYNVPAPRWQPETKELQGGSDELAIAQYKYKKYKTKYVNSLN